MSDTPPGRPTLFTRETADLILDRMSNGESLRSICRGLDLRPSTVIRWATDDRDGFAGQYAEAREAQGHALADELLDIADDGRNDWMARRDPNNSGYELNGEHVQRSRLRLDTRKWLASKILPKVYGEKVTQEVVGTNGGPVQFEDVRAPIASLISPFGTQSDDAA